MLGPEQTLQLQLDVAEALSSETTRDGIGLALAEVINKAVPFDFFLHAIWMPGATSGYRTSSFRNPEGKFEVFHDAELEEFRNTNFESFAATGTFLANPDNAGIYQGDALLALNKVFPVFQMGFNKGIRSIMVFNLVHDNGARHSILISSAREEAFEESQYATVKTVFPQIRMAYENLFKYERIRQEEENRKVQLELNNVLLEHTNREDFAIALAKIINKSIPCECFILRVWHGAGHAGYRIPLKRNHDGTFSRFPIYHDAGADLQRPGELKQVADFVTDNQGIVQGDQLQDLMDRHPLLASAANEIGVRSAILLPFRTGETTGVLVLGNGDPISFTEHQYGMMKMLLPQIMLAYDNLLKYEEMREEELERRTQLNVLTAFNAQKDVNQMALDAIGKVNDYVPFEYWVNITTMLTRNESQFRLAEKVGNEFVAKVGDELFKRLEIEPISAEEFEAQFRFLFEEPLLYVGDDFEELQRRVPLFAAFKDKLRIRSLATYPLSTSGLTKTVVMMGSTRGYAFSEQDVQSILRILPYIGMVAQQYFFMVKIQTLTRQLEMEKNYLVEEIKSNYNFDEIIGKSPEMENVFKQISQVASTDSTVLILGETGTGKELIARAIHDQSPRKDKVLVKVNCASLPAQLIESELFGHEKGSFTGALTRRIGKFELANGGTIFLDEIGELPIELQAKLLRVLQEREIERLGGGETIPLDVRVIAATNRDLETEVVEGRFRSDLFYRLNIFPIQLPPLRQRKDDMGRLIDHFLKKFTSKLKRPFRPIPEKVLQEMLAYDWPGNIRELENLIEQAVIVGDINTLRLKKSVFARDIRDEAVAGPGVEGNLENERIEKVLFEAGGKIIGPGGAASILGMRPAKLEEFERNWILKALKSSGGRVRGEKGAAEMLGMKPTTLEARIRKLNIGKKEVYDT